MIDMDKIIIHTKKLQLLYIEDNKITRDTTIYMLENFFDDIITAIDGEDGLEKFKNNHIDIVITDINMPNMDGLQMARAIKEINTTLPVFIFSAHSEANFFMDSIELGVEGYLHKPIKLNQFLNTLYKCIENLNLRKENLAYKNLLEEKVEEQLIELREKEKLLMQQSKMASMGEMIDAIAHQWKQPLGVIKLQSEIIEFEILEDYFDKRLIHKNTEAIKTQIEHLSDTINEFRNFFRPNHHIENININSVLNSIIILLKDELSKFNIRLNIDCSDDIIIRANENDIKHLIINIINNSKDALVKDKIDYANRNIEIICKKDENKITIIIKDNGKGIPENIIDNIFKPHVTTKNKNKGTGIGLYMSKQIIDKYNGTISAFNDMTNSGAVFKIGFKSI
jgi:signal transduction histidine kinase